MTLDRCFVRRGALLGALSLLCGFAPAPLPKVDRTNGDLHRLQGEWELIESRHEEGSLSPPRWPDEGVVIRGNRMRRLEGHREVGDEWTFHLNDRARPRMLDRQYSDGELLRLGIYQLQGDVLTIFSRWKEHGRPTECAKRGDVRFEVYKRRK